jgi:hypothetical protein
MVRKAKPDVIRQRMSADLLTLSNVLQKSAASVVVNADVLKSSANGVARGQSSSWSYQVDGLNLRIDVPQNTIPSTCRGTLTATINLELKGVLDCEDNADMLTWLIMELEIRSDTEGHVCAWHFDRHIEGGDPTEAHPLFHFQHGGHAMKPHADNLGLSLLLPAPRLPFPPMDAALAIDFILSNFSGQCWSQLRSQPEYCRLIRDAQALYWKPYVNRLSEWWGAQGTRPTEKILALWPQLA